MINRGASALDLHQGQQEQHRLVFQSLFSNQTCLGCLLSSPQHSLACGHALCDACVERYGQPPSRAESTYILEACPLCRQPCLTSIVLLPRTAAVRALTVDGGGIRGIVSLQILLTLQNLLGPHCPLPDLIDVAFGTSAGMSPPQPPPSPRGGGAVSFRPPAVPISRAWLTQCDCLYRRAQVATLC